MQRLFNIEKWTLIPEGKAVKLHGDRPRLINVEVNAPSPVKLLLVRGKDTRFLALVCGRDTVSFVSDGSVGIAVQGGECYVYTVDGEKWAYQDVDPESYTVVKERRERNYELELIAMKMAENMNRRMEQQAHEIASTLERRFAAGAAQRTAPGVPAGPGEPAVDGGPPGGSKPPGKRSGGRDDRGGSPDPSDAPGS